MVAGLARLAAGVNPSRLDRQALVDDDPVERGDRPARMEAGAGRRDPIDAVQLLEAGAGIAPFIGVAHQDRRHLLRSSVDRLEDRAHLPPPPQAGKVKVHADHPERPVADQQLGHHRSARFQRRQVERRDVHHVDMLFHQQRIAVPAEVAGIDLEQPLGMLAAGQILQRATMPHAKRHRPCTCHARRSARAARPRRVRRSACRLPAARPRRRRFPEGRGAPGRAAAAGRSRSPCAYYSWRR